LRDNAKIIVPSDSDLVNVIGDKIIVPSDSDLVNVIGDLGGVTVPIKKE
jgi:hypothetical protein